MQGVYQYDSSEYLNFCYGCSYSMGSRIVLLQENSISVN